MAEISRLRRRMIEDMTIRNLSPATQRSYISAVRKFSRYFSRSPDRLNLDDIRTFQVHLVSTGISWASLNQIVCALRFFYGITLGQDDVPERIPYARKPRKIPIILSADEVAQFLEAVSSLKARVALTTAYAAGLTVGEVCGLMIEDIDSSRMVIHVRHGKGAKARYVMLSNELLGIYAVIGVCRDPPGSFSRARCRQADRTDRFERRLSLSGCRYWPLKAGHRPYVAAFLCNAPSGEWHRYPDHPGLAWPCLSIQHCALCTGVHRHHQVDRQSP